MRIDKLFELQGDFFARYAEGFEDPELIKIGKNFKKYAFDILMKKNDDYQTVIQYKMNISKI